jgi:hypothetical protein
VGLKSDCKRLSPEARERVIEALGQAEALAWLGAKHINKGLLKDVRRAMGLEHKTSRPRQRKNGKLTVIAQPSAGA